MSSYSGSTHSSFPATCNLPCTSTAGTLVSLEASLWGVHAEFHTIPHWRMTPLWVQPPCATFVSFSIMVSLRRKGALLPILITTWKVSKLCLATEQSSLHLWKNQRRGWKACISDGESHEMGILGLKAAQGYWVEGRRQDKDRKQMLEGITGDRAGLWGTGDWTSHHCASCPSTTNVCYVLTGCCGSYTTWVKTSQAGNHVIWTNRIISISNSSQVFTFRGVREEVHTCATLFHVPFCFLLSSLWDPEEYGQKGIQNCDHHTGTNHDTCWALFSLLPEMFLLPKKHTDFFQGAGWYLSH